MDVATAGRHVPAPSNLADEDWEALCWGLQKGTCIVLVGPDCFRDRSGIPTAAVLAGQLATELGGPPGEDLTSVADLYFRRFDRTRLVLKARKFYGGLDGAGTPLLDQIAALPARYLIASCHDPRLTTALAAARKQPTVSHYDLRGNAGTLHVVPTLEKPLLYQLYGSIKEPNSLVLTEEDRLDFLVAVIGQNPPLPAAVTSAFQERDASFLFLGFDLHQWYLRLVLRVLGVRGTSNRSFAIELPEDEGARRREKNVLHYRHGCRIELVDLPVSEFMDELSRRLASAADGPPPAASGVVPPGAPKVFISHASEDKPVAVAIRDGLRARDVNAWADEELRIGDEFDLVIRQKLDESDYFVVLNSQALVGKQFSYVNFEINRALERQKMVRTGGRYILPVRIDTAELREDLSSFQCDDLVPGSDGRLPPAGLEHLARVILRDFQLRTRR